jgi:MIP family channel proteins
MEAVLWKSLLTEFLGTFTLVFVGASSVALTIQEGGSPLASAFAFGLALMVLIYTWGQYSGAHFNPAVSLGFAASGQMNWFLMFGYWIAQIVGGIAAAALVAYFFGTENGAGAAVGSLTDTDAWKAVFSEAIITFFLVVSYLFIYRSPMKALISGLAIGMVLTFSYIATQSLTGASANPARALGPAIFGNTLGSYWIYIVGPLFGALAAALVYKLFTFEWNCCDKLDECGNVVKDACGNTIKVCKQPRVDECGKVVTDCNGVVYDTYTKHHRCLSHYQETPMTALGGMLAEQGINPKWLKQEMVDTMEQAKTHDITDHMKTIAEEHEKIEDHLAGNPMHTMTPKKSAPPASLTVTKIVQDVPAPLETPKKVTKLSSPLMPESAKKTVLMM